MTTVQYAGQWSADTLRGRIDGSGVEPDWTTSLTGGPGRPARVGITAFSTDGTLATITGSPVGSPSFSGLNCQSSPGETSSSVGVAICTGPAPAGDPLAGFTLNETDLTPIQTWLLNPTDSLSTWWPLTAGTYYYLVVECWDVGLSVPPNPEACLVDQMFAGTDAGFASYGGAPGTDYLPTFYPTVDWGGEEEVFPVAVTFGLGMLLRAANSITLDIDWGDGTTETHSYDIATIRTAEGDLAQGRNWGYQLQAPPFTGAGPGSTFHHAYTTVGLYTLTATLTDGNGGTATATKPVAAVGPPTATLTVAPTEIAVPGTVAITVTSTSDAWRLMSGRSAASNPDGYDPAAFGVGGGAHTGWVLGAGSFTTAGGIWEGAGTPLGGFHDGDPMPPQPTFPANAHNLAIAQAGGTTPITLRFGDYFTTWQQELDLEVDLRLGQPPQRQFPRDDGLAASTRRSWPVPTSKQFGPRRGPVETFW